MHDAAFSEAVLPRPRRILKLPLRPYSIGHEILLLRHGNPLLLPFEQFTALHRSAQIDAVTLAALVCSKSWKENQGRDWTVRIWQRLIRNEDFALAIADFRTYRAEGTTCPPFPEIDTSDKPGRPMGAPILSGLITFVSSHGIWDGPTMDCPFGFALWCYYAEAESSGSCKISNSTEMLLDKTVRDVLREVKQNG